MQWRSVCAALAAVGLAACTSEPEGMEGAPAAGGGPEAAASASETAAGASETAAGEAEAPGGEAAPYKPVASNLELMESVVAHAAEEYWDAVRVVVDESGVTEHFPETDEEWEEVWAAGMSLAESGNLLMMPPRALDRNEWIRISTDLVDVGLEAAQAAAARDSDAVFEVGERVYYVCVECHDRYAPRLRRL